MRRRWEKTSTVSAAWRIASRSAVATWSSFTPHSYSARMTACSPDERSRRTALQVSSSWSGSRHTWWRTRPSYKQLLASPAAARLSSNNAKQLVESMSLEYCVRAGTTRQCGWHIARPPANRLIATWEVVADRARPGSGRTRGYDQCGGAGGVGGGPARASNSVLSDNSLLILAEAVVAPDLRDGREPRRGRAPQPSYRTRLQLPARHATTRCRCSPNP